MSSEIKDYYALNNLIEEILLNAAFCNLNKVPPQHVKVIMRELLSTFSDYYAYEVNHPDLIDTMLQRNAFCADRGTNLEYLGVKNAKAQDMIQDFNQSESNLFS